MKKIKNILVSGNSFTQDGIGGVPPGHGSEGGCSYINQGQGNISEPNNWVGMLSRKLDIQSLVNMAASSHGNILVADTIRSVIDIHEYPTKNTLVIVTVSISERLDVPCVFGHPDASKFVHWDNTLCGHTYLNRFSKTYKKIEKEIGLDIIADLGYERLDFLFNYLENKGYEYIILLTENEDLNNSSFLRIIKNRNHRLVNLSPGIGLHDFATITKHNTVNNYHPDQIGNTMIADQIFNFLTKQYSLETD